MRFLMLACALGVLFIASARAADGTKDDFQKFMNDMVATAKSGDKAKLGEMTKALVVPNSATWFKKVFGDDAGAKLAAEYAAQEGALPAGLEALLLKTVGEGKTEVQVDMLEKADDPKATGLQKDALAGMKAPIPLFSARLVKPGEALGMHLWSFVFVDGSFRLAGKMKAIKG